MAAAPSASAIRALALEYKGLSEDPVEGFRVKLVNEEDMFVWEVALFGPPDTLYQGGYFKVRPGVLCLCRNIFFQDIIISPLAKSQRLISVYLK